MVSLTIVIIGEGDRVSFKGKKNLYLCDCGHGFVTVDMDDGVTPFLTECQRPGCGKQAASMCYNIPQAILAHKAAVLEWYRPNDKELAALVEKTRVDVLGRIHSSDVADAVANGVRDHVQRGGLMSRLPAEQGKHAGDCECGECWKQMER